FSADGRTIATGSYDQTVGLWETATGGLRHRFGKHEDLVFSVAFAARGRLLLSCSRDCTALVWDATCRRYAERPKLTAADLDRLWEELAGPDAARAHQAIWTLASAPGEALPALQKRLQTPPLADAKRWAKVLDDLASPDPEAADRAARELEFLGD